jgi:NhaP-type Na+/H+ or K+/H+ antiporter
MRKKEFFKQFGTIAMFSLFGTIIAIGITGTLLYFYSGMTSQVIIFNYI